MSAFKEINPKEIVESPFKLIGDDWALVTAGDRGKIQHNDDKLGRCRHYVG